MFVYLINARIGLNITARIS